MFNLWKSNKRAATLSGYALMVGLVSVLAMAAIVKSGDGVETIFCIAATKLETATGGDGNLSACNIASTNDDENVFTDLPIPLVSPVEIQCSADGGVLNFNYEYPEVTNSSLSVNLFTPSTERIGSARVTVSGTGLGTVIDSFEAGLSQTNGRNHMCHQPTQPLCQVISSTVKQVGGSPYTFNNYNCSSPVTCRVTVKATGAVTYYVGDNAVTEAYATAGAFSSAREADNSCQTTADFAAINTFNSIPAANAVPCYAWQPDCAVPQIQILDSIAAFDNTSFLAVNNNRAFSVSLSGSGSSTNTDFELADISDPYNLSVYAGNVNVTGLAGGIVATDSLILFNTGEGNLYDIDDTNPNSLLNTELLSSGVGTQGMELKNDRLFIADISASQIQIYDVSTPHSNKYSSC